MSYKQILNDQKRKLLELKKVNINPYPAAVNRTHSICQLSKEFERLLNKKEIVIICGRIVKLRTHGQIIFADLDDGTSKIQILIKADSIQKKSFKLFQKTITRGDFIEVKGISNITKKNIHTLYVTEWKILSKSLIPIPSERFSLKDTEERYRKRYLDMYTNPDVINLIRNKSVFWNSIRTFMFSKDFVEVETPIISTSEVSAKARQFKSYHNALDIDVYLRISSEIALKKIIIGGLPKVFEIGRVFRNEGISIDTAQDYTAFEFYEAFQDERKGIPMVIEMIQYAAIQTFKKTRFKIKEFDIELNKEWEKLDFDTLIKKRFDFDPIRINLSELKVVLEKNKIIYNQNMTLKEGIDILWKLVRKDIGGPCIIQNLPYYFSPLGKRSGLNNVYVDEYKIILAGNEIAHMFNEMNDPVEQKRLLSIQQWGDTGNFKDKLKNYDLVEAMEYGMPPTFGFGCSERLFAFLSNVSIREAQIFPLLKD